MDPSVVILPLAVDSDSEPTPPTARNDQAHIASKLGIVGVVLVAGVIAIATNALVTALTTPDFMVDDITDDPFAATAGACVVPFIFGCCGLIYWLLARGVVSARAERRVAIRGLVLGIVNTVLPIAIAVVFINFDIASAACGGG